MPNQHFPSEHLQDRRGTLSMAGPTLGGKGSIVKVCAAVLFALFAAVALALLDRPSSVARVEKNQQSEKSENRKTSGTVDNLGSRAPKVTTTSPRPPEKQFSALEVFDQTAAKPIDRLRPAAEQMGAPAAIEPMGAPVAVEPSLRAGGLASGPADAPGQAQSERAIKAVEPSERRLLEAPSSTMQATPECLPDPLRTVLADVEARFGPVTIVSTTQLHTANHSPGSIREKLHLDCKAVDIRTPRDPKEVMAYLRSRPEVGGVNTYMNKVIHLDLNANYATRMSRR